jgi:hypothetical protein
MTTGINGQKSCILRTDEKYDPRGVTGLERVNMAAWSFLGNFVVKKW